MSLSPTITSPALMTNAGMLLGTAAYMSPEQAKGRPADKRSDLGRPVACCSKDSGAANFDISDNGTLVYVRASGNVTQRSSAWEDRMRRQQAVPGLAAGEYRSVRVGPGGVRLLSKTGRRAADGSGPTTSSAPHGTR